MKYTYKIYLYEAPQKVHTLRVYISLDERNDELAVKAATAAIDSHTGFCVFLTHDGQTVHVATRYSDGRVHPLNRWAA